MCVECVLDVEVIAAAAAAAGIVDETVLEVGCLGACTIGVGGAGTPGTPGTPSR
jgi:hypothetical protein